jgi:diguanylate cyclase (GGDEF)-like protein/PAS domain S-box-containing protein
MFSFSTFNYYQKQNNHIMDDSYENIELSKDTIINTIEDTEKNYELVGKYYEPLMTEALLKFQVAYENRNMTVENIDLEALKLSYSGLMDFYIIDEQGVVKYSTFPDALGLDFGIYPEFIEKLAEIRMDDSIVISKVTADLITNELRKWGYVSSPDHKYVLEVGINSTELIKYIEKLDYKSMEDSILKNNSLIKSVNVYDVHHYDLGYNKVIEDEEVIAVLDEIFITKKDKTVLDNEGYPSLSYVYIDTLSYELEDAQKIIKIKYDFSSIILQSENIKKTLLITIFLYMFISILLVYFITTKFITEPIIKLSRAVDKISTTNLNFQFSSNSDNEIGVLAKSFENMTKELNSTLISNDYLTTVLDSFGDFLAILDTNFCIERVNYVLSKFLNDNSEQIIGKSIENILLQPIDKVFYKEEMKKNGIIQNIEQVIINDKDEKVVVLITISAIQDKSKEIVGYILNSTNITNIKEKQAKLEKLNEKLKSHEKLLLEETTKDFLTKVYNRNFTIKNFKELEANETPYSIILCDIDFFKKVNDTYGHLAGDKVLIETADIMSTVLRKPDYVSRYGGEEFLIIVQDNNLENVVNIAEKIRIAVSNHTFFQEIKITISCGVTVNNLEVSSFDELIKAADKKMYKAKHNGRNRVEF